MTHTQPLAFDGFASPNYTQVPDELFDTLMTQLSDCELRVLLYIVRRTFGFKRDTDTIALSQMVSGITTKEGQVLDFGTGLSKSSVARGLKSLREKGVIVATHNQSATRGDQPTTYRLRFKVDATPEKPVSAPVSQQQDTPRVPPMGQAVSQPWDTQETDPQKTAIEYSKWDEFVDDTAEKAGEGIQPAQTTPQPHQSGSRLTESSLGAILSHRIRRDVNRSDRTAIGVAVERFAQELGDQADTKVSISRALNLYHTSGVSVDAFIDMLFRAKGEVRIVAISRAKRRFLAIGWPISSPSWRMSSGCARSEFTPDDLTNPTAA